MALFDIFGIGSSPDYLSGFMSEEERKRLQQDAAINALINAGAAMSERSGYSRTPVSLGQILGAGTQAGMAGYQGAMDRGVQELMTRQKLAEAKLARDRAMQIRALAPQLYKTIPEVTREVQEPGMNVPVPPQEGAVAPTFQTQYQPGQTTTEVVAPARRVINEQVLGQIAALQEDPLAALKTQAEIMPKLRAAGMTEGGVGDNPFDLWVASASSPSVKKMAQQYSNSFRQGILTDPDKINSTINNLATMDEKYIGRLENAQNRQDMFEQNMLLRKQSLDLQAQNQAAMQGLQQQSLNLRRDLAQNKIDAAEATKTKGSEQLDMQVSSLRDKYRQLQEGGGIVDINKPWTENIQARLGSTGIGQSVSGAVGSKNQSIRNSIAQQRPLLLQAIKNATGMSAKQMDSNAELQMYLRSATDPTLDIQANMDALDNLQRLFGSPDAPGVSGQAGKTTSSSATPKLSGQDKQALEWANANPRDPRAAEIKRRLGL